MNVFLHELRGPIHRSVPQGGFVAPHQTEMPQKPGDLVRDLTAIVRQREGS
jgi:hypothetical protein